MRPPMKPDLIRRAARGWRIDDALAIWERETAELARSDDWIAIAFEIARQRRTSVV